MSQSGAEGGSRGDSSNSFRGLLMVLANVAAADEAEFNRWYDREHMRERVAVPGFLSAQRYVSVGPGDWKYLALYHTESLATFTSATYREALRNQSPWSKQILARFRDPQRVVAERTGRAGYGVGGAVRVARLRPLDGAAEALRLALITTSLPEAILREEILEASLFESDPGLSKPVPEYPKSFLDKVRPDDWFLLFHAASPGALQSDAVRLSNELAASFEWIGTFQMLWTLHRSDL